MSRPELIILGGGCAGLSLGAALAASRPPLHTLILEPRADYTDDRTWGYWAGGELAAGPFEGLERRRWSAWEVRAEGERLVHRSRRYSYRALGGGDFYRTARQRIRNADGVRLKTGVSVQAIAPENGGFSVRTETTGHRCDLLADTRPLSAAYRSAPGLVQHFLGQEIETAGPVFDPDCVTLMDFEAPQAGAIHFLYLLPYSARRALVVDTWLSAAPFEPAHYRAGISDYLAQRFGLRQHRVLREESGQIPMSLLRHRRRRAPGWVRLGGRGGAVKASSGYAFQAIQRQVQGFAQALAADPQGALPPPARAGHLEWLDRIFLLRLLHEPAAAPGLFARLFRRVEPDALVRFLAERPRPTDLLAVMRALDAGPMLATAIKGWRQWV